MRHILHHLSYWERELMILTAEGTDTSANKGEILSDVTKSTDKNYKCSRHCWNFVHIILIKWIIRQQQFNNFVMKERGIFFIQNRSRWCMPPHSVFSSLQVRWIRFCHRNYSTVLGGSSSLPSGVLQCFDIVGWVCCLTCKCRVGQLASTH